MSQTLSLLHIHSCNDPMMWYASEVPTLALLLGDWPGDGYKSREPAGHSNVVRYHDAEVIEAEEALMFGGRVLMAGDACSIAVTYNNLTGRNFENPPPWQTQTHEEYLAMMAAEWGLSTPLVGATLNRVGPGNQVIDSRTVRVTS